MGQKGSAYERDICRKLSQWWSGNKDCTDLFWRSSMSGGRATVRGRKGLNTRGHHGDVCATDSIGQKLTDVCTIEIKRGYNAHTIHDCLDRPKKAKTQTFEGFFRQAVSTQRGAETSTFLLIHKRDRREPTASLSKNFIDHYERAGGKLKESVKSISMNLKLDNEIIQTFTCLLSKFFKYAEPGILKNLKKLTNRKYRRLEFLGFSDYRVGVNGTVWTRKIMGSKSKIGKWRKLKPGKDKNGYLFVNLWKNNKQHNYKIHKLVLLTFVGPCPPGMECCHFPDKDVNNNCLENLSWGTRKKES